MSYQTMQINSNKSQQHAVLTDVENFLQTIDKNYRIKAALPEVPKTLQDVPKSLI